MNKIILLLISSVALALQPSVLMAQLSGRAVGVNPSTSDQATSDRVNLLSAQGASGSEPDLADNSDQELDGEELESDKEEEFGSLSMDPSENADEIESAEADETPQFPASLLSAIPMLGGGGGGGSHPSGAGSGGMSAMTTHHRDHPINNITPTGGQAKWDESWQLAFLDAMNSSCGKHFRELDSRDGIRQICKVSSNSLSTAQKNLVKMALFQNLASAESGNDPMAKAPPLNYNLHQRGILQLDRVSMWGYRKHTSGGERCCPITNDIEDPTNPKSSHNPIASVRCGVTVASHWAKRDGHLASGTSASNSSGALGTYWQPMQDQDLEKKQAIYNTTAGFCKKLLNPPSGVSLATHLGLSQKVIDAASGRSGSSGQRQLSETQKRLLN